jgi:hypothetical protein
MTLILNTKDVQDLEFVAISDRLDSNWADWEVKFAYEGKTYSGYLGACPFHPELMQDTTITDIDESV